MLLKPIGQEEIAPSQTTVKDSGIYGELGQGNRGAENCAISEQRMDSHVHLIYGKSSFVKKNDDLLESGSQSNSEISTSHLNTSLLSEETSKLSEGNCGGSGSHHEGDVSSKLMVSSSAELCGESHTTENVECAIGVHGKDLNARDHVPISTPSESTQIRILNAVFRQSGIHNFDSDVPVVEVQNVKLNTDLSNMEHEVDGSLLIGECSRENEDDSASFGLIAMAVDSSSEHDMMAFILNEGKVKELTLWLFEEAKK